MDFTIRREQVGDRPFILEMLGEGIRQTYPETRELGRISFRERVEASFARYQDDPARCIWISELETMPVGCLWMTRSVHPVTEMPEAFILNLAVTENARGKGIGKALLEHGLSHFRAQGLPLARLFVNHDNPAAIKLYESLGFKLRTVEMGAPL